MTWKLHGFFVQLRVLFFVACAHEGWLPFLVVHFLARFLQLRPPLSASQGPLFFSATFFAGLSLWCVLVVLYPDPQKRNIYSRQCRGNHLQSAGPAPKGDEEVREPTFFISKTPPFYIINRFSGEGFWGWKSCGGFGIPKIGKLPKV